MPDVTSHVEVRRGAYFDSVTLLGVSQDVLRVDGVDQALVAMATQLNLDVLRDLGFDADGLDGVTPNDLVVAVRARSDALAGALAQMEQSLTPRAVHGPVGSGARPARTTGRAARLAGARLALISVPGDHAFVESMDALRAGLHVMLFSDNVPVDQEIMLKAEAERRDLLVMGPDCGTAIVGGVGLGFANVVQPGPVSIVAASGTGAQQVCCLLDGAGVGVRHVLGVGGRDLSAEVGAAASLRALRALDDDPGTELIIVVSKPPDPAVADVVRAAAARCTTPVVLGFVGRGMPDLTAVTHDAIVRLGHAPAAPRRWAPHTIATQAGGWGSVGEGERQRAGGRGSVGEGERQRAALCGLFSGGTLCDEAMVIATEALGPIRSNIPLEPEPSYATPTDPLVALGEDAATGGHVMIDFGDDALTRGRPHPMIDHSLRLARLERESRRPGDRVVLLDMVLGHAAEGDPGAAFGPAIDAAVGRAAQRGDRLVVVASLCGTGGDPQDLEQQARKLSDAGAVVHLSNANAAREAVGLVRGELW